MMAVTRRARPWLFVASLAVPAALYGQGFGLNEIGSCAIARGFANTGAPCQDASVIYWNPAAATQLSGWSVLFGAASISVNGSFTRDTLGTKYNADPPTTIVPNLFVSYRAPSSKAAWGLGVYVPYGLTSQWGSDFPGRFLSQKSSIQSIYIQPNVAYQITDKWSIGGGPIIGRSSVDLQQGIDASSQIATGTPFTLGQLGVPEYTEFAQAELKGSSTGYGAQIGLAGQLSPHWSFGARFLSPIWFKYSNATATFSPVATGLSLAANNPFGDPAGTPLDTLFASQFAAGGALTSQTASTTIVDPAQIEAGFGYTGFKDWLIDVDYDWVGWGQLDAINVNFANSPTTPNESIIMDYRNTSGVRVGVERSLSNGWKLRAGFETNSSAAPAETVTPLLPEQQRALGNVGFALPLMSHWTLDGAYSHLWTDGARGRIVNRTSQSQTAAQLNSGVFDLSANIISLSLRAAY
jgi:long-chain fatty acid transport protein